MPKDQRKKLIEALQRANQTERNLRSEIEGLEGGLDVWSEMFREMQMQRKQLAAQAGQTATAVTARDLRLFQQTGSLEGSFCIHDLFAAYLERFYDVEVSDQPAGDVTRQGGWKGLRHKKQALRLTSEQVTPVQPTYIRMSFFHENVEGNVFVVALKNSCTGPRWKDLFAQAGDDQLRFAVLIHELLLPHIPERIRDALMIEPMGKDNINYSYLHLRGVQETVECSTDFLRELCQDDLLNVYVKTDRHLRESLQCEGRSVHAIVEERFLGVIQEGVRDFNEGVRQRKLEEQRMLQRLTAQKDREAGGEKVDRRVRVPQNFTHNGLNTEMELPVPERVRIVLVPLLLAITCASNLSFMHGAACACCTGHEHMRNPLVDPFFRKYVLGPTRENARLLGHLIPRRMIEWACCWPLCEYLKKYK
jgi:hypothetical protein